jgi:hypothetical protein
MNGPRPAAPSSTSKYRAAQRSPLRPRPLPMPSPGSGYARIVCAELYNDRAGHDAHCLLRQAWQQYFRPDAVRDQQGTKAIVSQGGRFQRIVAANDAMAFGVEVNTRWSPWRQPNAMSPRQRFSYNADQRLRVKLDLASVGNGDRANPRLRPIAQPPRKRRKFVGRHEGNRIKGSFPPKRAPRAGSAMRSHMLRQSLHRCPTLCG